MSRYCNNPTKQGNAGSTYNGGWKKGGGDGGCATARGGGGGHGVALAGFMGGLGATRTSGGEGEGEEGFGWYVSNQPICFLCLFYACARDNPGNCAC